MRVCTRARALRVDAQPRVVDVERAVGHLAEVPDGERACHLQELVVLAAVDPERVFLRRLTHALFVGDAWAQVHAAGVPVARLRLVYVRATIGGPGGLTQAHRVLAWYAQPGAEPLILDNLVGEVRPASRRAST